MGHKQTAPELLAKLANEAGDHDILRAAFYRATKQCLAACAEQTLSEPSLNEDQRDVAVYVFANLGHMFDLAFALNAATNAKINEESCARLDDQVKGLFGKN